MPLWTFYDFMDDDGVNQIERWISKDVPLAHRAGVRATLRARFETSQNTDLKPPQFFPLHGACAGLTEIRFKVGNVPYRPLGYRGPGPQAFTVLFGAKEHNGRLVPRSSCETALARKDQVERNRGCVAFHDYLRTA